MKKSWIAKVVFSASGEILLPSGPQGNCTDDYTDAADLRALEARAAAFCRTMQTCKDAYFAAVQVITYAAPWCATQPLS